MRSFHSNASGFQDYIKMLQHGLQSRVCVCVCFNYYGFLWGGRESESKRAREWEIYWLSFTCVLTGGQTHNHSMCPGQNLPFFNVYYSRVPLGKIGAHGPINQYSNSFNSRGKIIPQTVIFLISLFFVTPSQITK